MYGTSRKFLEFFGLRDLNDLPTLKEFSALDPDLDMELQQEVSQGLQPDAESSREAAE